MKWDTTTQARVYLGVPTHGDQVSQGIISAVLMAGQSAGPMCIEGGSALTYNFNRLYCNALNNRKHGVTHFCMMHSDVWVQTQGWLDKLVGIMRDTGAGIVGTVISMKKADGETSTAIEEPAPELPLGFRARKLNLKDMKEETFTDPMLLLNTGLMLIDIRNAWAEKIWFEFKDWIEKAPSGDWYPVSFAEDYGISRMARAQGVKLVATRAIKVWHMGGGKWSNQATEGAKVV